MQKFIFPIFSKYCFLFAFLRLSMLWRHGNTLTCLSCNRINNPRDCHTSVDCDTGQVCYLHEFADLSSSIVYTAGCAVQNECYKYLPDAFGKRIPSLTKSVCCHTNLCNREISILQKQGTNSKEFGATGKDFMLSFGTNFYPYATVALQLLIVSSQKGNAMVHVPYLNISQTIELHPGLKTYNISKTILPDNLVIQNKGIRVTTDQPVTLFAMNLGRSTSDGFYAFPLSSLSVQYALSSSMPYSHGGHFQSEAVVVSPTDNNQVTFHLRMSSGNLTYSGQTYKSGERMTITMNAFDAFQFYGIGDITGTIVESSQPVAVLSGNRCNVFEDGPGCDHFSEMILPVAAMDTDFIVPKFHDHHNGTIQITAVLNNTIVNITSGQMTSTYHLKRGDNCEALLLEAAVITSTKNVQVVMFPHGANDTNHFDPFMISIPGKNKCLHSYNIAVPHFDYSNYIAVTVRQVDLHNMRLDGKVIQGDVNIEHVNLKGIMYTVFSHRVTEGPHTVHNLKNKTFGLMVYGNKVHDSYGFLAGINASTK